MFGYIRDYRPLLDDEAYESYRGVYCSLCRELGRRYGLLARMTLSYDGTFLALLRMSGQEAPGFADCRCSFNPTRKCRQCRGCDTHLAYAAQVSMLMVYYKLDHPAAGEWDFKLLGARALQRLRRR
ncbi:MAG: DUF5685 family protein, partial [Clostridiales bacterium]|nr:DUF5685 family protein [Clostridiales bacterium]